MPACVVPAQELEWVSYRDAYKAMVVFAKYGKAKNLLQIHYQVSAREPGTSLEGLHLTLNGKANVLNLPLDATGRAVFPLLKAAYDDNAVLALNRKPSLYRFQPRVSIVVRADGVYESAELRAACDQALQYQRYIDGLYSGKKCLGVRFVYPWHADAHVLSRFGPREAPLPAAEGPAFDGDTSGTFHTVTYRFSDWSDKALVVSQDAPLAIAPVFD
jgi:hypothetical protein